MMRGSGRWEGYSWEVIEEVAAAYGGTDEKELARLISDAYPFGPRKHHPYKIWRRCVREHMARFRAKTNPGAEPPVTGGLFAPEEVEDEGNEL